MEELEEKGMEQEYVVQGVHSQGKTNREEQGEPQLTLVLNDEPSGELWPIKATTTGAVKTDGPSSELRSIKATTTGAVETNEPSNELKPNAASTNDLDETRKN